MSTFEQFLPSLGSSDGNSVTQYNLYEYIATQDEDTFTGIDINGNTLGLDSTKNLASVYYKGSRLPISDFSFTDDVLTLNFLCNNLDEIIIQELVAFSDDSLSTTPILSGVSSSYEEEIEIITISNFNINNSYTIGVNGGTYSFNNSEISWYLPNVTEDTSHDLTVGVMEPGKELTYSTHSINVVNLVLDGNIDAAINIVDFSNNSSAINWGI